jgi:hypothetical protein
VKTKKKSKKAAPAKQAKPEYTHRDGSGMGWRFAGGRPVSALADSVMRDCGLPLAK